MKLFLYSSYLLAEAHSLALARLVGKEARDITIAAIANATDVEDDAAEWVAESVDSLRQHGARVDALDLRQWLDDVAGLRAQLAAADVIWVCGGNGFYLRWILKASRADEIIVDLVRAGTVYAGWSAGAVLAGPTLQYFDALENLAVVPEVLWDGLHLTDVVVLPHMDLEEFGPGMRAIQPKLAAAGFETVPLVEALALVIDGPERQVI